MHNRFYRGDALLGPVGGGGPGSWTLKWHRAKVATFCRYELTPIRRIVNYLSTFSLFIFVSSVRDSDPYVLGPPRSGFVSARYGSDSPAQDTFYHQEKIV